MKQQPQPYIGSLRFKVGLRCSVCLGGLSDDHPTGEAHPNQGGVLALHQQQGAGDNTPLWLYAVQGQQHAVCLLPSQHCQLTHSVQTTHFQQLFPLLQEADVNLKMQDNMSVRCMHITFNRYSHSGKK